MSKKMMKRSLALGALMAFVITGSAMAASVVNGDVETFTGEEIVADARYAVRADSGATDGVTLTVQEGKVLTIKNYSDTAGHTNSEVTSGVQACLDGKITLKGNVILDVVGIHNSNSGKFTTAINTGSGSRVSWARFEGNSLEVNSKNTNSNGYTAQGASGDGDVYFSSKTTTINAESYYGVNGVDMQSGATAYFDGEIVTIKATLTDGQGCNAIGVMENLVVANKVKEFNVTVEGSGEYNVNPGNENGTAGLLVYQGDAMTIGAQKLNITVTADDKVWTKGSGNDGERSDSYGVKAVGAGTVTINSGIVDITVNDSVGKAYALYADGTGANVDVTAKNATIKGTIVAKNDGKVNINVNENFTWDASNTGANTVTTLNGTGTFIVATNDDKVTATSGDAKLTVRASGDLAEDIAGITDNAKQAEELEKVAEQVSGITVKQVGTTEGEIAGAITADYANGVVSNIKEAVNTVNKSIGEASVVGMAHIRAHMNDMNKRMGELRMANGESGVWTRMVRGEEEFAGAKSQYNQYQLGYDEKLSVDKRWTVGAAVTFAEGNGNFANGSTENDSTAFAVYGSKLNNDGTFVDLIARYARFESDITVADAKSDYSTNGMSVSAEFGKRIQQGNGLWIEPQVELTYGTVDSAEYRLGDKNVQVGDMDSLIGRVGFSLGKDIKQGNVYARASYLYDFDGETETTFGNGNVTRTIKEDLGGGWWEVGVGANINLSKATYIYADVEKTFGGEVDTNWKWNLGVRYSF